MKKLLNIIALCASMLASQVNAEVINVTDSDIGPYNVWIADHEYVLDGFVFVEENETLVIDAGTVIRAKSGVGASASALIVARGGQIFANGTFDKPIIFTALDDDLFDPFDFGPEDSGEWGGVIILGKAPINSPEANIPSVGFPEDNIEGIPSTEVRGKFGGVNPHDSSGVFQFVSIRHGGTNIGSNNEINGLTLGGVGNGTLIQFVEVFANQDDGFEFFGGTVNTKYLIASYCGDDSFDYDQGFSGKGQFWIALNAGDRGGEHDGDVDDWNNLPLSNPTISNVTYVGSGFGSGDAVKMRENAGGKYYNSIFGNFGDKALDIETSANTDTILFRNNAYYNIGSSNINGSSETAQQFFDDSNVFITVGETFSPFSDPFDIPFETFCDPFFDEVDFIGAVGDVNWVGNWTISAQTRLIYGDNAGDPRQIYHSIEKLIGSGFNLIGATKDIDVHTDFSDAPVGSTIYVFNGNGYDAHVKVAGIGWLTSPTIRRGTGFFFEIPEGESYKIVID